MDFIEALDQGIVNGTTAHRSEWLTPLMIGLTRTGDGLVLFGIMLVVAGLFVMRAWPRTALILAVSAMIAFGTVELVKRTVNRPRPQVLTVIELPSSASFPSGHALGSMAVLVSAALLVGRRIGSRAGWWLARLAFLLAVLIGMSRVYLGVHYPSDVIGGWAGGLAIALLALYADQRFNPLDATDPAPSAPPVSTTPQVVPGS